MPIDTECGQSPYARTLLLRLDKSYEHYRNKFQKARKMAELGARLEPFLAKAEEHSIFAKQIIKWYEEGEYDRLQRWLNQY